MRRRSASLTYQSCHDECSHKQCEGPGQRLFNRQYQNRWDADNRLYPFNYGGLLVNRTCVTATALSELRNNIAPA